ncbi:hypothetical protein BGW80DRAFT_1469257 [Lactifluus volemus]|nr:hypothetical protein BGW80DRAFT_1469257 [Lactifluus volemus]
MVGITVVIVPSRSRFRLGVVPTALNDRHITRENRARSYASLPRRDEISIGSWQEDKDELIFTILQLHIRWSTRPLAWSKLADDDIEHSPLIGDVNLFFENPCEDPEFGVELRNDGSESWFRVVTMSSSPASCPLRTFDSGLSARF